MKLYRWVYLFELLRRMFRNDKLVTVFYRTRNVVSKELKKTLTLIIIVLYLNTALDK